MNALQKNTMLLRKWGTGQREVCGHFESCLEGSTPSQGVFEAYPFSFFKRQGTQPYKAWKLLRFAAKLPNALRVWTIHSIFFQI